MHASSRKIALGHCRNLLQLTFDQTAAFGREMRQSRGFGGGGDVGFGALVQLLLVGIAHLVAPDLLVVPREKKALHVVEGALMSGTFLSVDVLQAHGDAHPGVFVVGRCEHRDAQPRLLLIRITHGQGDLTSAETVCFAAGRMVGVGPEVEVLVADVGGVQVGRVQGRLEERTCPDATQGLRQQAAYRENGSEL